MEKQKKGTVIQIIKIKSKLSEEEVMRVAMERAPQFEAIPGIIQKYYIRLGGPGEFGGVYIWDSIESLKAFKESELATSIAQAYQALEPPSVEVVDIIYQLRD
ncbi:hypothetical protein V6R21_13660 [Limibacter armeniacum]|uniref:hypothetical protein n=1 Tax=Limibacter armeniacum TaxID=466084 RepID=UPI002FE62754